MQSGKLPGEITHKRRRQKSKKELRSVKVVLKKEE
jgi:hypothetical protein